jgi:hypothetical protein
MNDDTVMGIGTATLVVILFIAIFGLGFVGFETYSFYAPKYAEVQNKVFHQSSAYTQGTIQILQQYEVQYIAASPKKKAMLKSVILEQFSDFHHPLPPHLAHFYHELENYHTTWTTN